MDKIFKTIITALITVFTVVAFILMSTTVLALMTSMLNDSGWIAKALMVLTAIVILFWASVGIMLLPDVILKIFGKRGKKDGS